MKRSGTLFVITPDSAEYRNNLFYDEVRKGVSIAANLSGINVEFLSGFNQKQDLFAEAKGLIFSPDGSSHCRDFVSAIKEKFRIPLVQTDNLVQSEEAPPFDAFIGIDNVHGGMTTAQYLKSFFPLGSKTLVIAGSRELQSLSYNRRLDGFVAGSDGHFEIMDVVYGDFNQRLVYNRLHEYLIDKKARPDLIFAFNDDSAIVAHKVLTEMDIAPLPVLAGFDGSAAGRVALAKKQIVCSYDQDPENLGRKAVRLYLDLSQGIEGTQKVNLVRSTLLTHTNIGNTFYAGVSNFLDRTLTPFTFRKRRYELHASMSTRSRPLSTFKNELVCPIFLGPLLDFPSKLAQVDADKFFVISDSNPCLNAARERLVAMLRNDGLKTESLEFIEGERNKTPETAMSVIDSLLERKVTKKSCLILLGGGITGNLGGFVASILYRGIKFVHVPTTLMHMVDSSTGGKQAVDTTHGKNIIGNFYEPELIFVDTDFLTTLPLRELRSGLAECIKHALCQDIDFYNYIRETNLLAERTASAWAQVVERTIRLKLETLEKDSYELNEGMSLVYGHTLGHAIESASDYALTHGQSVGLGMLAAAKIAHALQVCSDELVDQHRQILETSGLPTKIPAELDVEKIVSYLKYDKKYVDKPMTFVLLAKVGQLYMNKGQVPTAVPEQLVRDIVKQMWS